MAVPGYKIAAGASIVLFLLYLTQQPERTISDHKRISAGPGLEASYSLLARFQEEALGDPKKIIGNIAWHPAQYYYYFRMVSQPYVVNVCEVGFGAGHSSVLWLSAKPDVTVTMFDVFELGYQTHAIEWIQHEFPGRFTYIKGDSNVTIPRFANRHPGYCDLISVDGSHVPPQPFFDIAHFKRASSRRSGGLLLLDDMHALKSELDRAIQEGLAQQRECLSAEIWLDSRFAAREMSAVDEGQKVFCSATYL